MRVQAALERVHIGAASSRVALVSPSNNSRGRCEPQICVCSVNTHTWRHQWRQLSRGQGITTWLEFSYTALTCVQDTSYVTMPSVEIIDHHHYFIKYNTPVKPRHGSYKTSPYPMTLLGSAGLGRRFSLIAVRVSFQFGGDPRVGSCGPLKILHISFRMLSFYRSRMLV